jgi:hypothetical protein
MLFLLLILNFAISWFNAWSVGRVWTESKMIGGFFRMTVWCGAIMSACGFTWVYIALLGLLAQSLSVASGQVHSGNLFDRLSRLHLSIAWQWTRDRCQLLGAILSSEESD